MRLQKGIYQDFDMIEIEKRGSLRVLTANGKHDIIRGRDVLRHVMSGYVVAIAY